ncbi:MAG: U32 family peptidase, partial [Bacteroidales bacterium]|nr:U32 family peptidase [Bacteroidales bacterium]
TDLETGSQLVVDNKYIMSPRDLCTIEFMDRIIDAGVTVFKIEGRARSTEYVKTVAQAYREAADAVAAGTYTPEFAAGLKARLETVFNRGFWDGYYLGAKMGQWSEVYGNRATRTKRYVGKVTNYFEKIGVAEILMETGKIAVGDTIVISGPTTGVYEAVVPEIRVDLKPVQETVKGELCSIPVPVKLRRSDKVFLFEAVEPKG